MFVFFCQTFTYENTRTQVNIETKILGLLVKNFLLKLIIVLFSNFYDPVLVEQCCGSDVTATTSHVERSLSGNQVHQHFKQLVLHAFVTSLLINYSYLFSKLLFSEHTDVSYFSAGILSHLISDPRFSWAAISIDKGQFLDKMVGSTAHH